MSEKARSSRSRSRSPVNVPRSTTLQSQPRNSASIIAVGNPGVGKSTILNSLAEQLLFKSGVSYGGGLTYQMDVKTDKNGRMFFDTPGLADRKLREAAGKAITQALKKGGDFKILFFLRIQSGRVVGEDITTFKLVLDSAPEIKNQYGVVINQVPSKLAKRLQDKEHPEHAKAFLTEIFANIDPKRHCSWYNITFLPVIEEVQDENDKVIPLNVLKTTDGRPFKTYVNKKLPSVKLTQGKANDIDTTSFEKKTEEIEELNKKVKEDEHLLKKKQEEIEQAQLAIQKAQQQAQQAQEQERQARRDTERAQEGEREANRKAQQTRDQANREIQQAQDQARREAQQARDQGGAEGFWGSLFGGGGGEGGSKGGTTLGALIGTAIFPGVGTALGAGLGWAAGGLIGDAIANNSK